MCFVYIITTIYAKDVCIQVADLPKSIQQYISKNFSGVKPVKIEHDSEEKTYKIDLSNGTEIEFFEDALSEIKTFAGIPKQITDSILNDGVKNYLKKNYPKNKVISWKIEYSYQEIELDNHLELLFSYDGNFLRIDR